MGGDQFKKCRRKNRFGEGELTLDDTMEQKKCDRCFDGQTNENFEKWDRLSILKVHIERIDTYSKYLLKISKLKIHVP